MAFLFGMDPPMPPFKWLVSGPEEYCGPYGKPFLPVIWLCELDPTRSPRQGEYEVDGHTVKVAAGTEPDLWEVSVRKPGSLFFGTHFTGCRLLSRPGEVLREYRRMLETGGMHPSDVVEKCVAHAELQLSVMGLT